MRDGKYVIDSIESGLVKLLFSEDETIEEIVNQDQFIHTINQGDVLNIKIENGKLISVALEAETRQRREQAERLLEKLKKK
jgi:hypothetical protein